MITHVIHITLQACKVRQYQLCHGHKLLAVDTSNEPKRGYAEHVVDYD
jgi:hypothetical protein